MSQANFNNPRLINPIVLDVPEIQILLGALAKMDFTGMSGIPLNSIRINRSGDTFRIEYYNGSGWADLGKMLNVTTNIGGKEISVPAVKDTIPLRDSSGRIAGDILGNSATASAAQTLSQTLSIEKGGTAATTSAQARVNLGCSDAANIVTGTLSIANGGTNASSAATARQNLGCNDAANINEGVLKVQNGGTGVNSITNLLSAIGGAPSGFGLGDFAVPVPSNNWNSAIKSGFYQSSSALNSPTGGLVLGSVFGGTNVNTTQLAITASLPARMFYRSQSNGNWSTWAEVALGESASKGDIATTASYGVVRLATNTEVAGPVTIPVDRVAPGELLRQHARYEAGSDGSLNSIGHMTAQGAARFAFPGDSINISLPKGSYYTAPDAGWVAYGARALTNDSVVIYIENITRGITQGALVASGYANYGANALVPCSKGDTVFNNTQGNVTVYTSKFIFAKGVR